MSQVSDASKAAGLGSAMNDDLRALSDGRLEEEVLRAIAVLAEHGRRLEQKRSQAQNIVDFTATPLPGSMSARP